MPNSLYNSLHPNNVQNGSNISNFSNMVGQMNQLRSNPIKFLAQRRLNLPPNFQGGPKEMVEYFISSGQMSKEQFENLLSMIR